MPNTRAPLIGRMPGGVSVIPSKNGGFFTYVEPGSHAYKSPSGTGRLLQLSQKDRTALSDSDWLGVEIDVHSAGKRVRDDERRRRQIVEPRERIDAPLEVAVARQHRGHHQLVRLDGLGDRLRQWT
jgi:hypothetical protein